MPRRSSRPSAGTLVAQIINQLPGAPALEQWQALRADTPTTGDTLHPAGSRLSPLQHTIGNSVVLAAHYDDSVCFTHQDR